MELLKGFLGIRLSSNEYFSVLSLDDTSVKKMVLGKLADETNIKLDFYVSEYENFSNPIIIGSFFLDNLDKDSLNVNIYFKIDSMMLYVYGECDGITNKTKFDLSLMSLSVNTNEVNGDSLNSDKVDDLPIDFQDTNRKESFDSIVEEKQDDSLDFDLSNVNDLSNSKDLLLKKENDLDLVVDSLNLTNDMDEHALLSEGSKELDSESNVNLENLDFAPTRDKLEDNPIEETEVAHVLDDIDQYSVNQGISTLDKVSIDVNERNDVFDNSENDVKSVKDKDDSSSSFNVYVIQNSYSDDLSVEDIIADVSKNLDDVEFDDVSLDLGKDNFTVDVEEPKFDPDLKEDRIQTSMLYLSLVSLFLLIFFSLFLIFSKILNPKNFTISYCSFYKEEKITRCEKSNV
ncbi:uncharacterized conserved protein [Borrelia duttonii Ly]|uniref:Uncharacterized conserved protein n=1 Tax=Borrelia duttonii (strain Ly) TaxID=412419 RepID=B5RL86_BORDL|nr:uncharacterized conserved protein [Borrelia duttonii Ly]